MAKTKKRKVVANKRYVPQRRNHDASLLEALKATEFDGSTYGSLGDVDPILDSLLEDVKIKQDFEDLTYSWRASLRENHVPFTMTPDHKVLIRDLSQRIHARVALVRALKTTLEADIKRRVPEVFCKGTIEALADRVMVNIPDDETEEEASKREAMREAYLEKLHRDLLTSLHRLHSCGAALQRAGFDSSDVENCADEMVAIRKIVEELIVRPHEYQHSANERQAAVSLTKNLLHETDAIIARYRELLGLSPETADDILLAQKMAMAMATVSKRPNSIFHEMKNVNVLAASGDEIGFRGAFAGLLRTWHDKDLMTYGLKLWEDSYKLVDDRGSAEVIIEDFVAELYSPATEYKRQFAVAISQFAGLWAHDAFQKIITTHTYGAALMASDASRDSLSDLHLPWRAFQVVVPDGLLKIKGSHRSELIEYKRVLVWVEDDGTASFIMYDMTPERKFGTQLLLRERTLADLLHDELVELSGVNSVDGRLVDFTLGKDEETSEQRALRMAKRLVTGLLMAMTYTDNFKVTSRVHGASNSVLRGARVEPQHRVTFVGKPLKIDLRMKVDEYLNGANRSGGRSAGRAPSVQTLVRGHYKRQVIGVGRTGRKVIWIEPFWRGSEDAPILTKPKKVG